MDELTIGEQKYVSSKRAAEITGYAKDYIGQLCREGRVEARLVGRSWYVREAAIKDHRFGLENASPENEKSQPVVETGEKQWTSPKYVAEAPFTISVEEPVEDNPAQESSPVQEESVGEAESLDMATQMQEAWQAWFSQNKVVEEPEHVEITKIRQEREIEPETPLIIRKVEEPPVDEESPVGLQAEKVIRYRGLRVALFIIAISSISIAILGTGLITAPTIGLTASATNFISGTNIYSK